MRRSRPSLSILALSLFCGIFALLPLIGINLLTFPIPNFALMAIAWAVLLAGVLFPRL